ncbi:hypothetical protein [Paraburkholderia tropica]|uniref:hypothetical protein n=1 Tax=Paraburkholderia tropica TaxID=92647 RepID=UPI0033B951D1
MVQPLIVDSQLYGRGHYSAVENLSAPSHRYTSRPLPFGLRLGADEYVNGRLSCDFRYEVRPAHSEGAVSHGNYGSIGTHAANVMAFYLEGHAVHVLIHFGQLDVDFEAAIADHPIHHFATLATSPDVSPSSQSDDVPNSPSATVKGRTECVVRAIKWAARTARLCFCSRGDSRVFAVRDGFDNVVLRLARGREPTFDRCPHLPTIECIEARFHKSPFKRWEDPREIASAIPKNILRRIPVGHKRYFET